MTTDDDRKDRDGDRAEAAFSALSGSAAATPEAPESNPWKPAALLLLLMALALPLAFGIRASRVKIEFEGRIAKAAAAVAEVQRLAEAGELAAAVDGLAAVTATLADVEGLDTATRLTREMAERKLTDLETERGRVAERDRRLDRCRDAVDLLLAGDPNDAVRRLRDGKTTGSLEEDLERLALRLDTLCVASGMQGEARASALELLTTAWKLPALEGDLARAREELRRDREVAAGMKAATEARSRGEIEEARRLLDQACRTKGLSGIGDEFAKLRPMELTAAGNSLKAGGDHAGARACFVLAGNHGLAEVERGLAEQEIESGRRKYLLDRLERRLEAAPDHRTRAAIAWMLGEITGDSTRREEAVRHAANGLLAQAREFRGSGELEAALALSRAAEDLAADGAAALTASVVAELSRNQAAERLKQADAALRLGAPAYAAYLASQNPAIDAELLRRIRVARREHALTEARARFDRDDFSGARAALEGLPADDPEVRELSVRLILATGDGDFVVTMPKDAKAAEALLYRAVLHRFRFDPAAAGRILATFDDSPAGIAPSLAAFLDAADRAEDRTLWKAVAAEVAMRLPEPRGENSGESR